MRCRSNRPRLRGIGRSLLVAAVTAVDAAAAVDYYLATDVPVLLGTSDYTPDQIVLSRSASYSLAAALPSDLQFGALHRRPDGVWLFSPAHPVTLGGNEYEPRDVVAYNGSAYSPYLDGSTAGLTDDVRIDALFLESNGDAVLSFDVPVTLGGNDYGPSDLVRRSGSAYSMYWLASIAGVPAESNLVGAAKDANGTLVVTFDIPTIVPGSTFLPGELVWWDASENNLLSYFVDPNWPPDAQLRDFSFLPPAGEVPRDADAPGGPLLADKATGADITLAWSASCATTDTDYEIYEGSFAAGFASHLPKLCSTSGSLTATFTPAVTSSYFLVVPRNAVAEGSHGHRSDHAERVGGSQRCLPQSAAVCPVNP